MLAGLLRHHPAARISPSETAELLHRVITPPRSRIRRRVPALAAALTLIGALAVGGSAQGDEQPPAVAAPAGFTGWSDPTGFRVAVPAGWTSSRMAGAVTFSDPAELATLRISRWTRPPDDVVAALLAEERANRLPGYRRLRIEALLEPPDAVWEYTYTDPESGPMRGTRRVLAAGDTTYVVEWRTPRSEWAADLPKLSMVLESFD